MCHEQWALTVIKLLRFFVLIIANRRAVCNGRIYKLKTYIYSITSTAFTYKNSVMLPYKRNYAVLHANS